MPSGTPGEPGMPRVATPGARGHQQAVGVAVVAAVELDDLAAAGEAAGHAQRAHRGLGARRHEAHLLHRGHALHHALGQLHLGRAGRAVGGAAERRLAHGLDDLGVGVAQDHGPPGAHVVDVALAVGVHDPRALGAAMKSGVPPTALKARTGELTPPGMTRRARANRSSDWVMAGVHTKVMITKARARYSGPMVVPSEARRLLTLLAGLTLVTPPAARAQGIVDTKESWIISNRANAKFEQIYGEVQNISLEALCEQRELTTHGAIRTRGILVAGPRPRPNGAEPGTTQGRALGPRGDGPRRVRKDPLPPERPRRSAVTR